MAYTGDIMSSLKYYHDLMARVRANEDVSVRSESELDAAEVAQAFGAFEEIRAEGGGRFFVRGWMIDNNGFAPDGLALEIDGDRYPAYGFERVRRPDVMRHFGLSSELCGFTAWVDIPGALSPAELPGNVRMLGGASAEFADAELRIAPSALVALGR